MAASESWSAVPDSHSVQLGAVSPENVPLEQVVHRTACHSEKVPLWHPRHGVDASLSSSAKPGIHEVQFAASK